MLARLVAGMDAATAAALTEIVKADAAKAGVDPLAAFRTSLDTFVGQYERKATAGADGAPGAVAWAKRETALEPVKGIQAWNYYTLIGDITGSGETVVACKTCLRTQTPCACAACGNVGPGNYCYACGIGLAYCCPKCSAPWAPMPLGDIAGGGRISAAVTETRTSADKKFGIIRAIVTGNVEDDYGTIISPRAVAALIKPGACAVDIDHQVCKHGRTSKRGCAEHDGPITGAECLSSTFAMVPYQGKNVEAAIVETRCSLDEPRSKMLYDGAVAGTYPELSIQFTYPPAVAADVAAGRQKQLDETNLISVPAYTFTRKGHASNPMAKVTEIRMARVVARRSLNEPEILDEQTMIDPATMKPAGTTAPETQAPPAEAGQAEPPAAADPLAELREAAESFGEAGATVPAEAKPEGSSAPSEQPPAATPEATPAGGSPELSLEAVSKKVDELATVVEGMRTAAASSESTPRLAELGAAVEAVRTSLATHVATATDLAKTVEGQRTMIAEVAKLSARTIRLLKEELARLKVHPPREGHSGVVNGELSEALRTLTQEQVKTNQTAAERAEQIQRELDEKLGALGVSAL